MDSVIILDNFVNYGIYHRKDLFDLIFITDNNY